MPNLVLVHSVIEKAKVSLPTVKLWIKLKSIDLHLVPVAPPVVSLLPAVQSLSIPNFSRLVSFESIGKWNKITMRHQKLTNWIGRSTIQKHRVKKKFW
jgi:hypothetical protein